MEYSKAQLLNLANEYALELGVAPVAESVFESWISRQFFAGARSHGVRRGKNPEWTYPERTLQTVKLILTLQSLGARRTTQMVVCLWIFGTEFPSRRLQVALKSELRRIVRRQARGPSWFADHHSDLPKLTAAEQ